MLFRFTHIGWDRSPLLPETTISLFQNEKTTIGFLHILDNVEDLFMLFFFNLTPSLLAQIKLICVSCQTFVASNFSSQQKRKYAITPMRIEQIFER